jgi:hypothetical protein
VTGGRGVVTSKLSRWEISTSARSDGTSLPVVAVLLALSIVRSDESCGIHTYIHTEQVKCEKQVSEA